MPYIRVTSYFLLSALLIGTRYCKCVIGYTKFCELFQSHKWIWIWVTFQKRPIQGKSGDFESRVTLKFDGWPWKQQGISSMQLQALCIISYPSVKSNLSYSLEMPTSGQNWWFFAPCELDTWRMTLKNKKAYFPCYFKPCASFRSHRSIQTGVTVRKRQTVFKIDYFLSSVTLKLNGWPQITIRHLFDVTPSFVHNYIAIGQFKLELQSKNS